MRQVIKAFWPTIRKFRWWFAAFVVTMGLNTVCKTVYPYFLRRLTDHLTAKHYDDAWQTFWIVGGLVIIDILVWALMDISLANFQVNGIADLDRRSFRAIQMQSIRFMESWHSGSLAKAAGRFKNAFEYITDLSNALFGSIAMILIAVVVFALERFVFAVAFGFWAVFFFAVSYWFASIRMKRSIEIAKKDSKAGGVFGDSLANYTVVTSFAMEQAERERFDQANEDIRAYRLRSWLLGTALWRIQAVSASVIEILVLWMMVWGWRNGTVTMGDFVFFQTYVLFLIYQIQNVGRAMHTIMRCVADAKEMAEIYQQVPEVRDTLNARPLRVNSGQIEFHAVCFNYLDQPRQNDYTTIDGFDLMVKPGEVLALVGHSGAGKSTLVKLLLRLYDLSSGYIAIDGQDIVEVTQCSLHQQIAFVPQEPGLFNRSVLENIRCARPDASVEEVFEAARLARAWEFIQELPEGFETVIGERGLKLSGGERQRIALARAFLADTPILILDEATSSLDSVTEHKIQKAIKDLLKGRTCIVIAHRLSTIQGANRIVVMEKGAIVEKGSHPELLHRKGVYFNLWSHQTSYIS